MPAVRLILFALIGAAIGVASGVDYSIASVSAGAASVIAIGLFYFKKYFLSFLLASAIIGFIVGVRISNERQIFPDKIVPQNPAVIDGKVLKTLSEGDNHARILFKGRIDARALPPMDNERAIISVIGTKDVDLDLSPGSYIFGECKIRPPRKAILKTDFSENVYAASVGANFYGLARAVEISNLAAEDSFLKIRGAIVDIIKTKISDFFPERVRGFAFALSVGDRSEIPYETKQNFSKIGAMHVLAVSGLHVGIFASIIYFALIVIRSAALKFALFAILTAGFIIVSGMQPSAVRAGLMALAIGGAALSQRRIEPVNAIAVAALLMILINPRYVFSVGFQMSISAILGIAVFYPKIYRLLTGAGKVDSPFLKYPIGLFSVSLAASIFVSPIVAFYFDIYSIVSPLANLAVVPLMTLGMIYSILSVIASFILAPCALVFSKSATLMFDATTKLADFAAGLPYSHLTGTAAVVVSIASSLALIYVFYSDSWRLSLFRAVAATGIFIVIILNLPEEEIPGAGLYPREKLVAAELPLASGETFFLLADRSPKLYPSRDFGLEDYISEKSGKVIVAYTGAVGKAVADTVAGRIEIETFEAPRSLLRQTEEELGLTEKLPQIIDLEPEIEIRQAVRVRLIPASN